MIVWVDPGKSSGVAIVTMPGDATYAAHELNWRRLCDLLTSFASGPQIEIGWESFTITRDTATKPGADIALKVIGMLMLIAHQKQWVVLPSARPGDRQLGKVEWLKKLGWYPKGMKDDDAKSASQHLLAYMLRSRRLPEWAKARIFE